MSWFQPHLVWRSLGLGILLSITGLTANSAVAQEAGICPAQLSTTIASIIDRPQFHRARWGILVQLLDRSAHPPTLYAHDAERYFIPASNAKLLTTAAVLDQLGASFRIRTSVYQIDSPSHEITLQVVGRGDPSLTDAELQTLARQIRDRGITQINQLIATDQFFRGDAINPTWEWEDIQAGYGAPVNSLILNQNSIGLTLIPQQLGQPLRVEWDNPAEANHWQIDNRSQTVETTAPEFVDVGRDLSQPTLLVRGQLQVGSASELVSVSIPQPASYFLQHFQQALSSAGIQVDRSVVSPGLALPQASEIAAIESPPLADLLIETNRDSNNLYAEALLRILGVTHAPNADSSLEAGITALTASLTHLGVHPDGYHLVDGSGLSRRDLISPDALVETLQAMARSPNASTYRASLSVAGVNGTLQHRFQNTPLQGKLYAKSGSLNGVIALSGYLEPPNHVPLVISIIVNQLDQPLPEVEQAIDHIVTLLSQLHPC
jgi:D-alanyl-D-alanine carboxypeptidase/D-alanyl-D-alanine-endopeptidase (penicillin-binding protein 4)